jgi:hypothetical protein
MNSVWSRNIFILLIPVALMLAIILPTGLNYPPNPDEVEYHYPAFLFFLDHYPNFMQVNYCRVVTGPLPYIIASTLYKIVNVPWMYLRLISIFFWFFAVLIIHYTARKSPHLSPIALASWLVSPFIFTSSLFFGGMGIAVFCMALIMSGALLFRQNKSLGVILSTAGLTITAWSRQSELYFIIPFLYLYLFSGDTKDRKYVFSLLIPILAFLPLFLLWHDIKPPYSDAFEHSQWTFEPRQITLTLSVIGFTFLPIGFSIFRFKPIFLLLGLIGITVGFLLPFNPTLTYGIFARFALLFYSIHPVLHQIIIALFAAWGIYCFVVLWQNNHWGRFLYLAMLVGTLMLLNVDKPYEKYQYSLLLPLFILIAGSDQVTSKQIKILYFYNIFLSILYFLRISNFSIFYEWLHGFGWFTKFYNPW